MMNVSIMTGLLLAANIFGTGYAVALYIADKDYDTGYVDKAAIANVWANTLGAVSKVCFFESHWLLTMHYWTTANNTLRVYVEPTSS